MPRFKTFVNFLFQCRFRFWKCGRIRKAETFAEAAKMWIEINVLWFVDRRYSRDTLRMLTYSVLDITLDKLINEKFHGPTTTKINLKS